MNENFYWKEKKKRQSKSLKSSSTVPGKKFAKLSGTTEPQFYVHSFQLPPPFAVKLFKEKPLIFTISLGSQQYTDEIGGHDQKLVLLY